MQVSVVLGTAREGRRSLKVARYIEGECRSRSECETTFVDVKDHLTTFATIRLKREDTTPHPWKDIARGTDGFIFIIPEYNHGYPGEWKLLMDSLYKSEYMGKVAGLVGVSTGAFGGVRALELATLSLSTRGMYVIKDALHFPRVDSHFDAEGTMINETQHIRTQEFIDTFLETVQKYR